MLLQIPTAVLSHTVISLSIHEPGGETICWKKGKEEERKRALQSSGATSQLTAWFKLNAKDENARSLTFLEVPRHYVWEQRKKEWVQRKKTMKTIARIFPVSPRYAERFAIRLLVLNVRGATSFEDLRTLDDGTECSTFTEAARVSFTECKARSGLQPFVTVVTVELIFCSQEIRLKNVSLPTLCYRLEGSWMTSWNGIMPWKKQSRRRCQRIFAASSQQS